MQLFPNNGELSMVITYKTWKVAILQGSSQKNWESLNDVNALILPAEFSLNSLEASFLSDFLDRNKRCEYIVYPGENSVLREIAEKRKIKFINLMQTGAFSFKYRPVHGHDMQPNSDEVYSISTNSFIG